MLRADRKIGTVRPVDGLKSLARARLFVPLGLQIGCPDLEAELSPKSENPIRYKISADCLASTRKALDKQATGQWARPVHLHVSQLPKALPHTHIFSPHFINSHRTLLSL